MKSVIGYILCGVIGGVVSAICVTYFYKPQANDNVFEGSGSGVAFGKSFNRAKDSLNGIFSVGFSTAAERSLKPVVHIRSVIVYDGNGHEFLGDDFWTALAVVVSPLAGADRLGDFCGRIQRRAVEPRRRTQLDCRRRYHRRAPDGL